jgi:ketosteroid isomerase-like protein
MDMKMRFARCLALVALVVSVSGTSASTLAQEEGAEDDACPTTTEEQNIAIVESYFAATGAGDAEAMDEILNDDYAHLLQDVPELAAVLPSNEPGNADEIARHLAPAPTGFTTYDAFADGDQVAVSFSYVVSGANIEGAAPDSSAIVTGVGIVRIECGGVAGAHIEFESLGTMLQLGFSIEPAGT